MSLVSRNWLDVLSVVLVHAASGESLLATLVLYVVFMCSYFDELSVVLVYAESGKSSLAALV